MFRSDQFVRVRLIFAEETALTVPVVSVVRVSGQYFVYVAEPGDGGALVARLRSVSLGSMIGDEYLLLAGVSEGDRLITSGIQKIGDGVPVQPTAPGVPGGLAAPGGEAGAGRGEGR